MASRSSSELPRGASVLRSGLAALALFTGACSTVRPEEKEFLAQPAMTFGSGGEEAAQEEHVISNREASFGGGGVSGGGCGCN